MDIEEIKKKVMRNEYEISFHAEKERYAEEITISDLEMPKRPRWIDERRRSRGGVEYA